MISTCAQNHAHREPLTFGFALHALSGSNCYITKQLFLDRNRNIFLWDNQWQNRNCFLPTSGKSVYRALLQPLFRRHFHDKPLYWTDQSLGEAIIPRAALRSAQGQGSPALRRRVLAVVPSTAKGQGGHSKPAQLRVTRDKHTFFPFSSAYQF